LKKPNLKRVFSCETFFIFKKKIQSFTTDATWIPERSEEFETLTIEPVTVAFKIEQGESLEYARVMTWEKSSK